MLVAAVQFAPVLKDSAGNLAQMVGLVTRAASQGAQLIVLPELASTGYSFMSSDEARPFAEDLGNYPLGWSRSNPPASMFALSALAKDRRVAIAWGVMTINWTDQGYDLYNSQVLVLPDGSFKTYEKVNLWGNDFLWATPGSDSPPIIRFEDKRIGMLICRDIRDKATGITSFYEKGDADIVVFSSNFGDGGFPSTTWVDFAKDNEVTLVVSNRYGREANNNFGEGGVCVIEAPVNGRSKIHCQGLEWNKPCIVYAEV